MKKLILILAIALTGCDKYDDGTFGPPKECGTVIKKNGYENGTLDIVIVLLHNLDTVHVVQKKYNQLYYDSMITVGSIYCENDH